MCWNLEGVCLNGGIYGLFLNFILVFFSEWFNLWFLLVILLGDRNSDFLKKLFLGNMRIEKIIFLEYIDFMNRLKIDNIYWGWFYNDWFINDYFKNRKLWVYRIWVSWNFVIFEFC